jgi:hypothetical protein
MAMAKKSGTMYKIGGILLIIAAAVVLFIMQHRELTRLRNDNDILKQEVDQGSQFASGNQRLQTELTQASTQVTNYTIQVQKLQAEVTALRRLTNDVVMLREQLRRLRATTQPAPETARSLKPPPEVPPQDIHPKESWKFAGYTTPDAALETTGWAMSQGNREQFLAGFTPEARQRIQDDLARKNANFGAIAAERLSKTDGFRIVKRDFITTDQAVLRVFSDGEDQGPDGGENVPFRKINGQWKIAERQP